MANQVVTATQSFVLPGDESHQLPWGAAVQLLAKAFIALDALLNALQGIANSAVQPAQLQQSAAIYAADTGAANAYVVAFSPAPTLAAGSRVLFKALHANTAASTLAVNGGAAKAITKSGTTALAGGEIAAGQIMQVVYDGTQFQIV